MEAEHKESTSNPVVGSLEGPQYDKLGDDRKARVIGRTWCRAARRMARWAATEDDDWQQGSGEGISPTRDE
jgi:hypothetical protein